MPMNQRLEEIYGTEQGAEADLEKLAAAELAEKLASEGGLDLASLDPEQLEELTREVMGMETGSDQEKLADADYLGRVMAHSYTQEMNKIAAEQFELPLKHKGGWSPYVREPGIGGVENAGRRATHVVGEAGKAVGRGAAVAGKHIYKHRGKYMLGGAGAGLASAGGYAAYKHFKKNKHSSAFETLAEARAQEILEENGLA
jgi:hypothetical protein